MVCGRILSANGCLVSRLDISYSYRLSTPGTVSALGKDYDSSCDTFETSLFFVKMNQNSQIVGVEFKQLVSHPDDRGFFREIIRDSDSFFDDGSDNSNFAQWSHSKMAVNTVKAWHFHHLQTDWWYLPIGLIQTVLIDNRSESPTFGAKLEFFLGESQYNSAAQTAVVRIPPGVLHGCKVLSPEAHLFYITSQIYDPQDEGRIPFNSPKVNYNWGNAEELIVSARDTQEHIPPYQRVLTI